MAASRALVVAGNIHWGGDSWLAGGPSDLVLSLAGFAVHEAVAILLLLVYSFVPEGYSLISHIIVDFLLLGLFPELDLTATWFERVFLFLLVFSPYFATVFWLGWQRSQRPLAAFAVFPHAALAMFLYFLVQFGPVSISEFLILVAPAAAAAIVAVFFWRPPSDVARRLEDGDRVEVLYVGVPIVQISLLFGTILFEGEGDALTFFFFLFFLTLLGWIILSAPLLLPHLPQLLLRALKTNGMFTRHMQQCKRDRLGL